MARPAKQGLDYFALDVTMNDEVEIIEATHGLEGFAILIKLFQKIYSEGYFYEWGDKEQILFSNRVSVDRNKVTSIVSDCINWGIFSKTMYEKYNILTSKRIQSHYLASVYKRTNVEIIKDYMLIESDVTDRSNVTYIRVSDINNFDVTMDTDVKNKDATIVSDIQSTQSKSKSKSNIKVKENKDNNMSNTECSTDENSSNNLPDNQNASSSPVNYQKIQEDYNAICIAMPKCRSMTDKRKKKVRVLFKNLGEDIEAVRVIFEKAQASDFLSGRNGDWSCNFDWLINYNNAIKVLEGNYDNKATGANESKLNDPRYKAISDWYKEASTT